jgi:hypothetical protein
MKYRNLLYFLQSQEVWVHAFFSVSHNTKTLILKVDFEFDRGPKILGFGFFSSMLE